MSDTAATNIIPVAIKLYHGTAASRLPQIQQHGIAPRSVSKARGNKSTKIATRCGFRRATGHCDAVYLGDDSDPSHFALNCVSDPDGSGLVLEVPAGNLRPELIYPDEHLLSKHWPEITSEKQCSTKYNNQLAREARSKQHLVARSLAAIGSVAYYGTVPWSAVSRYVIIDYDKLDRFWQHFATHHYDNRAFTHWLFADPVTVSDFLWPLQKYAVDDTTPEANRAWTRWMWDHAPDYPVVLGDEEFEDAISEHAIEATVEACPVEDRKYHVEEYTEYMQKREGAQVVVPGKVKAVA
jgi:hypothetical protein